MIQSKSDYQFYLEADRIALDRHTTKPNILHFDYIWIFQRLLRKLEYYKNCKQSIYWKPYIYFLSWRYLKLSVKLGFTIPLNVIGPGLSLAHRGAIVINKGAKIGENCRLHTCVNIGTKAGSSDVAPHIGNNVYIGPGVKLFGDISIADDVAIGANSVVNRSFKESGISIAGIPAKKISDKGSSGILIKGTEKIRKQNYAKKNEKENINTKL